jgi:hypothetical protein
MILIRAAHWFNPAVWLAFRRLRAEQELACDAAVMARLADEERRHYGRTLLKLLDDFSPGALCPGLVPFITSKQIIKRRITMISCFKPAGRIAAGVSLVLLLVLGSLTFTRASEPTNPIATRTSRSLVVLIGPNGLFQVGSDSRWLDTNELQNVLQTETAKQAGLDVKIHLANYEEGYLNSLQFVINAIKPLHIDSMVIDDGKTAELVRPATSRGSEIAIEQTSAQISVKAPLGAQQQRLAEINKNIDRSVKDFEAELKQDLDLLKPKQANVDFLREKLEAGGIEENSASTTDLVSRQGLNIEMLHNSKSQAEANLTKLNAELSILTNLNREMLIQTLPTIYPDSALTSLLQDKTEAEQKLATQLSRLSAIHPDVQTTTKLLEKLNAQIDDRAQALLAAIRTMADAEMEAAKNIDQQIQKAQRNGTERDAVLQQYVRAKTELEQDKLLLEDMRFRLEQTKADLAMPPQVPDSASQIAQLEGQLKFLQIIQARLREVLKQEQQRTK